MVSLIDAMLGYRALEQQGYSQSVIEAVLTSRVFRTEGEMYAALDAERERQRERQQKAEPKP